MVLYNYNRKTVERPEERSGEHSGPAVNSQVLQCMNVHVECSDGHQ